MKQGCDEIELLRGTPDMLILRTLLPSPAHGHQIAKHIQRSTEDVLQVEHGSLYPALHRLEEGLAGVEMGERRGKARAQVLPADSGRQEATGRGRVQLEATRERNRASAGRSGELI
jgi:DNA-binding PadR family transcriptional regulator